jgi:hypothetical protein
MADVYNRKRQPENMNDALRRARAYVSDAEGRPPAARSH